MPSARRRAVGRRLRRRRRARRAGASGRRARRGCGRASGSPSRTTRIAVTRGIVSQARRGSADGEEATRARPSRRGSRGSTGQAMRPRRSLRRSRSERPPQMPKRSSFCSAYSRHCARTSQRGADLLGVAGRAALLGEERLGVGLRAQRVGLPGERVVVVVDRRDAARDAETDRIDEPVLGNRRDGTRSSSCPLSPRDSGRPARRWS